MEPPPPSDLNTHLPPRKRLLAGLRTAVPTASSDGAAAAATSSPLPSPPAASAGDLAARLREMALAAGASGSSPEEMIEAAREAAQAAADAAVAARAVAVEKAAVAAKARAAARAAMELLDSFSSRGAGGASRNGGGGGLQFKVKSKKKHVQVKMLYRPNGTLGPGEAPRPRRRKQSDEEAARSLHRVMNSSPRISHTGPPKRPRTITPGDAKDGLVALASGGGNGEGGADACNGSSIHVPIEAGGGLVNGCSEGKSTERTVPLLNHEDNGDAGKDSSRHSPKTKSSGDIADDIGAGAGNLSAGQKVKIKRKELLLNQNSGSKETEEPKQSEQPRETEPFVHSIALDESKSDGKGRSNPNGNGTEKLAGDTKAPGDGLAPMKITSVWKFKKLKTSHCSSDSKVLHKVCPPPPAAAETSASVKAD